jgi:hypothetical protein
MRAGHALSGIAQATPVEPGKPVKSIGYVRQPRIGGGPQMGRDQKENAGKLFSATSFPENHESYHECFVSRRFRARKYVRRQWVIMLPDTAVF